MVRTCTKLRIMLWKQMKSLRQNKMMLIVQLVFPILLTLILLLFKYYGSITKMPSRTYKPFCPISENIPVFCNEKDKANPSYFSEISSIRKNSQYKELKYFPCHTKLDKAMHFFEKWFEVSCTSKPFLTIFGRNNTFALIEFEGVDLHENKLPNDMFVNIRFPGKLRLDKVISPMIAQNRYLPLTWQTNNLFSYRSEEKKDLNEGGPPYYFQEGFLAIQHAIAYFIIFSEIGVKYEDLENVEPTENIPDIRLQRLPMGPSRVNHNYVRLEVFTNLIFMIVFVFHSRNLTMAITKEKEEHIKLMLTFLGIPHWMQWLAWFFKAFVLYLISVTFITVMLTVCWLPNTEYRSFFSQTKPLRILEFLIVYSVSMITFSFMVTTLCNKATYVSKMTFFLWSISILPYYTHMRTERSQGIVILGNFAPNTAMSRLIFIFLRCESLKIHLCTTNSVSLIISMLLVSSIIFFILTLYFEEICSPYPAMKKKWYFPFTFCLKKKYPDIYDDDVFMWSNRKQFQREPVNLKPGIKIKHLSKMYKNNTLLDRISLNAFENEITVLLAHRGAGASDLIDILIGVSLPTMGAVYVANFNVTKDMKSIRKCLGYCPETNVYFDYLTVKEHFRLVSKLRGGDSKTQINNFLEKLNLKHLENKRLKELDENYIRRMCVALAFCGNISVIILNKPTANVSSETREIIWKFIQENSKDKTILVSTDYMDEAISLDGKIAMLVYGSLYACGSHSFLNKNLGAGYYLVIERKKSANVPVDIISTFIRKFVTTAELVVHNGLELHYILQKSYSNNFEEMFSKLDENKENLSISYYYITSSTLEEIFLRTQTGHTRLAAVSNFQSTSLSKSTFDLRNRRERRSGCGLIRNQMRAMLFKNWLLLRREINCFFRLLFIYIYVHLFYVLYALADEFILGSSPARILNLNMNKMGSESEFAEIVVQNDGNHDITKYFISSIIKTSGPPIVLDSIEKTAIDRSLDAEQSRKKYFLLGAEFSLKSIKGWFNNEYFHASPKVLGLILDAVYKKNLGEAHSITFVNKPMRFNYDAMVRVVGCYSGSIFQLTLNYGIAMALMTSSIIVYRIREISTKYKLLQFISGLKPYVHYFIGYLFNVLLCNLISLPVFILFATKNIPGFDNVVGFGIGRLITTCCSFAYVSFIYIIARTIKNASSGILLIISINLWLGPLIFAVMEAVSEIYQHKHKIALCISYVFPLVAYCHSIKEFMLFKHSKNHCQDYYQECMELHNEPICHQFSCDYAPFCCEPQTTFYFPLFITLSVAIVLTIINLMIDYKVCSKTFFKIFKLKDPRSLEYDNSDMHLEKIEIENENIDKELIVKKLTKFIKKEPVIYEVSFGIGKFGCVGLLGPRGCGKSAIIKMIVGEIRPSGGEIIIHNKTITTLLRTHQNIGYCSQSDTFPNSFTANEILKIHCLIKGIPPKNINFKINNISQTLTIDKHLYKRFKHLDTSSKSLLKIAVAVIGEPTIIVLDEPTYGIELEKKAVVRDLLNDVKDEGRCIIISSCDMQECTLVCNKIGIIINGRFKCFGSPKAMAAKYAHGYSISITLYNNTPKSAVKQVESYMRHYFPNAARRNIDLHYFNYYIEDEISCAKMFGLLERAKKILPMIESYTISKSNLEKVYLAFTRYEEGRSPEMESTFTM